MFIRAKNGLSEILINKNHIKYSKITWCGPKNMTCKVKFFGVDNELIGEKEYPPGYGSDQEIIDILTTTIVPVAGAGYTLVRIIRDEDSNKPIIEETPIIAFRVSDELYGVPPPVIVDEDNNGIMHSDNWGIKMPNSGEVFVSYDGTYKNTEAFLTAFAKKSEAAE